MFRVRARNAFGWGSYSPVTTIKAATLPTQVLTPTTAIDSTTGGIKVSWSAPSSNGDAITAYLIEISDSLSVTWVADTTDCDGSSATVMSNLYCIIPMSSLTVAPYNYVFD